VLVIIDDAPHFAHFVLLPESPVGYWFFHSPRIGSVF